MLVSDNKSPMKQLNLFVFEATYNNAHFFDERKTYVRPDSYVIAFNAHNRLTQAIYKSIAFVVIAIVVSDLRKWGK